MHVLIQRYDDSGEPQRWKSKLQINGPSRHYSAPDNLFGVSVADMQVIAKRIIR